MKATKAFFLSVVYLVSSLILAGQNAPVTTIGTACNTWPGQVAIPITVNSFNNIGAVSLSFDYAYAGLHYISGIPNPLLPGFAIGDMDLGNGKHRVTMGWFGPGTSLPDGTVIMTVNFTYLSGITALDFYDIGPSCEYTDADYNVLNDIPQSAYYINGTVCGFLNAPGQIAGKTSVCQGEEGVTYMVEPLSNATGYTWTLPPGAVMASGSNTNIITVNFSPSALTGLITVCGFNACCNGPVSQLPVTLNSLPLADAGQDVTIPYGTSTILTAAPGGSGLYQYQWMPPSSVVNPNQQSTPTINMTNTTVFTLAVTDQASQCTNTDAVVVTTSGGPLSANPVSSPGSICHGSASQLVANAGGGSGNYAYTWTCTPPGNPPWISNLADPIVIPDSSRIYHLAVSDGFNTAQGTTQVAVSQLPTAVISGDDTLCGTGLSTILTITLSGTPPWTFYYSNGILTWFVQDVLTSPYDIVTSEPGTYTILSLADANCTGTASGTATVGVYPVPPAPVISVNGSELFSTGCCGNQWYLDGQPLPGATGQVYLPNKTGNYFDIVTVDGCTSDTSNHIYYIMTGTGRDAGGQGIHADPNPSDGLILIRQSAPQKPVERIGIYSISGVLLFESSLLTGGSEVPLQIDLRHLNPGIYVMLISSATGSTSSKLVIK